MFAKFRHWTNLDRISGLIWLSSFCLSLIIRLYWHWPANCEPLFGLQLLLAHFLAPPLITLWSGLNLLFYDLATHQFGSWTVVTASTYALVSWLTSKFLRAQTNIRPATKLITVTRQTPPASWQSGTRQPLRRYLVFTLLITVFYDLLTASMGPLWWGQSWSAMLWGQIPFTIYHLLSNLLSAVSVYALLALICAQLKRPADTASLSAKFLKIIGHLIHPLN